MDEWRETPDNAYRRPVWIALLVALSVWGCAPSVFAPPKPAEPQCPQGYLLACEEQHDTPSLPRDKRLSDYEHCTCVQVRF